MIETYADQLADTQDSARFAPGVTLARSEHGDIYAGTVDALLAAGVVLPHQLPGAPGNGRTMVSFHFDGRPVGRGNSTAWQQLGYLQVRRTSLGRLCVTKGIGKAESIRRFQAFSEQSEREEAEAFHRAHCWPFPIICGEPPQ